MAEDDPLISLQELADRIGPRRDDRPTTRETVRGWCLKGLQGVLLWSDMRGHKRVTTWTSYQEWLRRVDDAKGQGRRGRWDKDR
jgi:hypothetical protein